MLIAKSNPRAQVMSALSKFRQVGQEPATDKSLLEVEANIGMVLPDSVNSFGRATPEQSLVLGLHLVEESRDLFHSECHN